MADVAYEHEEVTTVSRPNWGAIWAGVFTFIGIWSVFGLLGMAIFTTGVSPNGASAGMEVGMGFWTVILTAVSMYIAGRATGKLAGVVNSHDGIVHGIVMFGLGVTASIVIGALGNFMTAGAAIGARGLNIFSEWNWVAFVSLFCGWLAAMAGASSGTRRAPAIAQQAPAVERLHHA
jgi:hypothetical protein